MPAVTIDFDCHLERVGEARHCLVGLLPCKARISGGKKGFHVLKLCVSKPEYSHALELRKKYDDPARFSMDRERANYGLTGGFLNNTFSDPWLYTSDINCPFCFCWNKIPGGDSRKLAAFLHNKFGIAWARAAQIESADGGTMIRLTSGDHIARLRTDHNGSQVTLEIDGNILPEEFIPEWQTDKLMVYCTWSNIKCIELVERQAEEWMDLENEEQVRSFLNGHDAGPCLGHPAGRPGRKETRDRPPPRSWGQDKIAEPPNGTGWQHVSSLFWHIQSVIEKGEPLDNTSINHKDVLPELIEHNSYDGAITQVFRDISALLRPCLSDQMGIAAGDLSEAITTERPAFRRYELEVLDHGTNTCLSALTYYNGEIGTVFGNLPVEEIKTVLKRAGKWERNGYLRSQV